MTASRGRTGRPPLTETRRAEIRREIARAAVELFVTQGVASTTGEQIGRAVGLSARTVWRYFPSKESCVTPLFSEGVDAVSAFLRQWPPGRPLREAVDRWLTEGADIAGGPDRGTVGALVRLTRTEPGLRAVWLRIHDEAEQAFARALAERSGLPADDLRVTTRAAMFNAALRAAVEHHAWHGDRAPEERDAAGAELVETLRQALAVAAQGVG
ncbi:TetR/AcrR family transcriptional regulator [Streptomyces fungicidicus]